MPCNKGRVTNSRMTFKATTLTDKETLVKALRDVWQFPNEIVERGEDVVITGIHGGIAVTLKSTADGYQVATMQSNLDLMDSRYEYGFVPALKTRYNERVLEEMARDLRESYETEVVDNRIRITVGR